MSKITDKYPDEYLERFRLTGDVANALYFLLRDLENVPAEHLKEPGDALDSIYGKAVFEAFLSAGSGYSDADIVPRLPGLHEPGYPQTQPVIFKISAGRKLHALLLQAREEREAIDTSNSIVSFAESIRVFFGHSLNGTPRSTMTMGAAKLLPHALDWTNVEGAGEFGEYFEQPHFTVTHHTQQQAHVAQILSAFMKIKPENADENFAHEIMAVKTILSEIVEDLSVYFFDQDSITRLHTERIQNGLFDSARDNRVYVARLALNVSDMNDLDHTEEFGSFVLDVMKK